MDHITDYFKKYKQISQSTIDQKKVLTNLLSEFNITVTEDALMLKSGALRIFCTHGHAMHIRTIEQDILKACRTKNINASRIITVIVG